MKEFCLALRTEAALWVAKSRNLDTDGRPYPLSLRSNEMTEDAAPLIGD